MNKPTIVLTGAAALAIASVVALDWWNRLLESAVALPVREPRRRHPSIPGSLTVRAPVEPEARHAEALETWDEPSERTFFELAEASLALDYDSVPKVFCTAKTRSARTGYVVNNCSVHEGHDSAHRDMHTGATWKDQS
jgi:hypothetical protein